MVRLIVEVVDDKGLKHYQTFDVEIKGVEILLKRGGIVIGAEAR